MRLINNFFGLVAYHLFYFVGYVYMSCYGVRLGKGAKVHLKANVKKAAYIGDATIGKNVTMGEGSYINSGLVMNATIGQYCSIAYHVLIGLTEHDVSAVSMSPYSPHHIGKESSADLPVKYVEIADEVWIGAGVIILQGVKIGYGSVIAAGAVVTKNVPPMEIWGGRQRK